MNPLQTWYNKTHDAPRQRAAFRNPPIDDNTRIDCRILIEVSEPRFSQVSPAGRIHAHALLYCTYVHTSLSRIFPDASIAVNTTLDPAHRVHIDVDTAEHGEHVQKAILDVLNRVFLSGAWRT
jgi:hypothetical protein